MSTYTQVAERLTGRNHDSRKVANNTYMVRHDDSIGIVLHNTEIVTFFPDGTIALDHGGWRTNTTKERINSWAPCRVQMGSLTSGWTGRTTQRGIGEDDGFIVSPAYPHTGPGLRVARGERFDPNKLRDFTPDELMEQYMAREISMPRVDTGLYQTNRWSGVNLSAAKCKNGTWQLTRLTNDGFEIIASGLTTLRQCRQYGYRWAEWQRELEGRAY
jgi:hypothetical protein